MGFNIKNREAHLMAQELSKLTGESMTTAVTIALRERLDRVRQQQGLGLAERLLAIGKDCAVRLKEPFRPPIAILAKAAVKVSLNRLLAQAKLPWGRTKMGATAMRRKMGRNQLQQKRCAEFSSRRQDLIDQLVVPCVEWIDEFNSPQCKTVLQILGEQMTDTGPLCRGP